MKVLPTVEGGPKMGRVPWAKSSVPGRERTDRSLAGRDNGIPSVFRVEEEDFDLLSFVHV